MDVPIPLPSARQRPARMLAVDDIAGNRDLLTSQLRRQGHCLIETAHDGIDPLERILPRCRTANPPMWSRWR
jgi:hypothetical protein